MAYVKNTWVDQKVQRPKTYNFTNNDDGSTTLIDAFGNVEELGTPVNADNMNHIEDGLANVGMWTYNSTLEYNKDDAVIAIIDDKFVLYKSLQNNNKGNALTNTDYWEEVKLGGSSGLEVCDIGTALYIDETKGLRRRLNGQIVDANTNTQGFIDKLVKIKETNPDYFTDENTWQSEKTMNVDGCVYKFVLNYSGDNVVSVRLPKYPDYVEVNAGGTLPVVGNGLALGMTDGTSTKYTYQAVSGNNLWSRQPGNFTPKQGNVGDTTENVTQYFGDYKFIGITTDASKSGIETTLKQTKLKLYYFIQIATGVETEVNIKDTLELNNPFTFGMNMYFKGDMENISWLKSAGQQNAKALYPDFYNWVLANANAGKDGFKLSTASDITDYDFEVNTTNETFRLPLIAERVLIESKKATTDDPSWYNLYSDGWCEQGGRVSVNNDATSIATFKKKFKDTRYYANWISCNGAVSIGAGTRASDSLTTTSMRIYNGQDCVMLANWTACGYTDTSTIMSNYNLYYFVGETVKIPNLIDAGRLGENLVNKVEISNTQWATNACMPDYSAGVSMTSPWTAPFDAECHISTTQANGTIGTVYVNNYFIGRADSERNQRTIGTFSITVKKGDVVTGDGWITSYSNAFPIIGGDK
nr:MAG TPA: hypothetical protein [Caudoviricetes sp.]